jgi:two-component system, cell cycle response regulator
MASMLDSCEGQALSTDDNTATDLCDLGSTSADEPEAQRSLPMYLIVLAGGIPGAMIPVTPSGTPVGRSSGNSIQLADPSVSRHHAVMRADDDGKVRLTDLASSNGTFLNGHRLLNHTPAVLHDGDRIQFGSTVRVKFARPDLCEERFQREMFERTVRDPLTGLFNRSYFLDQVDLLAEQGEARGLGLAILMIDIDHFKRVNDTQGHSGGDVVLKEVSGVIRLSTRSEDLVARYGGEEFVVALPIASLEHATERAERIRHNLLKMRIAVNGMSLRVTASIGLAFAPPSRRRSAAVLLDAADLSMYQAKNHGRNRVVCSQSSLPALSEMITRDDQPCRVLLTPLPGSISWTAKREI